MTSLTKENLNTEEKTEEKTESIDYQSISQVRDIFINQMGNSKANRNRH